MLIDRAGDDLDRAGGDLVSVLDQPGKLADHVARRVDVDIDRQHERGEQPHDRRGDAHEADAEDHRGGARVADAAMVARAIGQAGAAGGYLGLVQALRQLTDTAGDTQVANARIGLVSGFGMINYDRGICTAAALLERGQ